MIHDFEKIRKALADHNPLKNSFIRKRASVLIPLLESEGEIFVMLTRPNKMRPPFGRFHFQVERDTDDVHGTIFEKRMKKLVYLGERT